ncbi:peptidoglycan-binding domain-containing protein [Streptomyces sp. NPDC050147]|uniref:peptidoglycan-binding domain-containing protein n=1 Tax=Streptomyces sp. NPDC050147 TaxID=3155513 RepID=UPI003416986B
MNVRKRLALAATTAVLGSGLALGSAAGATASPAEQGVRADVRPSYSCGYYNGTALTKAGQTGSAAKKRIKEVQCLINRNTSYPTILGVDGKFGNKTYKAVVKVQQKARISDDGQVGKNTWKKLRNGVFW